MQAKPRWKRERMAREKATIYMRSGNTIALVAEGFKIIHDKAHNTVAGLDWQGRFPEESELLYISFMDIEAVVIEPLEEVED